MRRHRREEAWLCRGIVVVLAVANLVVVGIDAGPKTPPAQTSHGRGNPLPSAAENAWVDLSPAPSARLLFAMTYDSAADRVVIYGGNDAAGSNAETWAHGGVPSAWENVHPFASPPALSQHAMAYDASADRVILFGGFDGGVQSDKTWSYNSTTNRWTNMLPSPSPPIRVDQRMAYDAQSERVVMVGGSPYTNLTWVYDGFANTWTSRLSPDVPTRRWGHAMAYDAQSDRIVLFGGQRGVLLNDTWTYDVDNDTWQDMLPAASPPGLTSPAMAYDAQSDRVVLFGGWNATESNETWAYNLEGNRWTKMAPAVRPLGRAYHEMAYSAPSDRVILFGGTTGRDTWAYDFDRDEWSQIGPPSLPMRRDQHAMAFDAQSDRAVLFGGFLGSGGMASDTWLYDPVQDAWRDAAAPTGPSPRYSLALAYDARLDRTVLFGGGVSGGMSNETWTYDVEGNAWTNVTPSVSPSARMGHGLVYDSHSDRVVLFGGLVQTGFNNDTWVLDLANGTWEKKVPASGPSPRAFFGLAYDVQSDLVILNGGLSGAGRSAETWTYNLDTDVWTRKTPATPPPARERGAMAYDAEADRVVLFGGSSVRLYETWAYDVDADAWTNLAPRFAPKSDRDHAMAYDPNGDRIVLFGGTTTPIGRLDGTWLYVLTTGRPSPPRLLDARLTGPNLTNVTLEWDLSGDDGAGENDISSYEIWEATTYDANATGYARLASLPNQTTTYVHEGAGVGDPALHFYEVRAIEAGTGRFAPTLAQAAKYTRAVSVGMHLLNLPLQVRDASVPSVLQSVPFDMVRAYRAADATDPWKAHDVGRGGDLTDIRFADAFWVNVTAAGAYVVAGLVVERPSVGLLPGWNLVGYAAFRPVAAGVSLFGRGVVEIQGFDSSADPYRLRVVPLTEALVPGEGYWVKVAGLGGTWIQG